MPAREPTKKLPLSRQQRGSTTAAGEDQKGDDDDPDAVVVIEKIAEAVIHKYILRIVCWAGWIPFPLS